MKEKSCSKCGLIKSISDFQRDASNKTGYYSSCKGCNVLRCKRYNATEQRRSKILERNRIYDRTESGRKSTRPRSLSWSEKNIDKRRAHWRVKSAIKSGKIKKQPCKLCRSETNIHAHHDDYSRPLDIMWLCPQHHKDRHAWLKQQEFMI